MFLVALQTPCVTSAKDSIKVPMRQLWGMEIRRKEPLGVRLPPNLCTQKELSLAFLKGF